MSQMKIKSDTYKVGRLNSKLFFIKQTQNLKFSFSLLNFHSTDVQYCHHFRKLIYFSPNILFFKNNLFLSFDNCIMRQH